ncbi:hypothetical protein AAVH_33317, partial [Aphelenchoides avenae]
MSHEITLLHRGERPKPRLLVTDPASDVSWYPQDNFIDDLSTHQVIPVVAVLTGIRMLIGLAGIALNSQLIWVTIRTKALHGKCNVLIALNALACAVHELSYVLTFVIAVTGVNLIPLQECYWILLAPAFAKYFTLCLLIFIGIDRLKSALLLHGWPTMGEVVYVAVGLSLCGGYSVYIMIVCYQSVQAYTGTTVMCSLSEIPVDEADKVTFTSSLALNFASLGCYCLLWIVLIRAKKANEMSTTSKLFKSLYVIMAMEFFGWGSDSVFQFLQDQFWSSSGMSTYTKWEISTVVSYLLAIATTANGPVLFFC